MEAYRLYNSKGKKVNFKKLAKDVKDTEFVFFGEYHDNPISHWLQLEVLTVMQKQYNEKLMLGFEMFEQDQQELLNSYLEGKITDKEFEKKARLWPNYKTDYKPLIKFAIENNLQCVASNIPRRYASMLFKYGRDTLRTLTEEEKSWIAPLDFKIDTTLSQYIEIGNMAVHMDGMSGKDLMQAQAIKDATMAYFSLKNMEEGNVVLHINGAFHSDFYQGIMWYIRQSKPEMNIITISTVSQENISKLDKENRGKADYILCVPENMTSTH
tara:strand:+ start:3304 stop:4110 length:807 start_codon:yes stop_codon:yes gene_type:complete